MDLNLLDQRTDDPTTRPGVAGVQARASGRRTPRSDRSPGATPPVDSPPPSAPSRSDSSSVRRSREISISLWNLSFSMYPSAYISTNRAIRRFAWPISLSRPRLGPCHLPGVVRSAQPPLEFLDQPFRLQQQGAHVRPHRLVQAVHSDRGVAADRTLPGIRLASLPEQR